MEKWPISYEFNSIDQFKLNQLSLKGNIKYIVKKINVQQQQQQQQGKQENFKTFGLNGEVINVLNGSIIEIWDWEPHGKSNNQIELNDYLHLVGGIILDFKISKIWFLNCNRDSNYYQLIVKSIVQKGDKEEEEEEEYEIEQLYLIDNKDKIEKINYIIPSHSNISIIANNKWIAIADNLSGDLNIFKTKTLKLSMEFKTKISNFKAVFDLKGDWITFLLNNKLNLTKIVINNNNNKLLNKLLNSLGKTTLDSFLSISQLSQNKINQFYNHQIIKNEENSNDTTTTTTTKPLLTYSELISNWFNSISNNCDYPVIFDLSTSSPSLLCQFQLRDKCSKISLSPNDLNLITVSKRGDDISFWDFTNFSKQIILKDKWKRGKTNGIIDSIKWFKNKNVLIKTMGSNSIRSYDLINGELLLFLSNSKFINFNPISNSFNCYITNLGEIITLNNNLIKSNLKLPEIKLNNYPKVSIDIKSSLNLENYNNNNNNNDNNNYNNENIIEIETCKPFIPLYAKKNYKFIEFELNQQNLFNLNGIKFHIFKIAGNIPNIQYIKNSSSINEDISISMSMNL